MVGGLGQAGTLRGWGPEAVGKRREASRQEASNGQRFPCPAPLFFLIVFFLVIWMKSCRMGKNSVRFSVHPSVRPDDESEGKTIGDV